MGWTDKLGDAWDSAKDWALDDSLTKPTGSAIGAAYSAADDSLVGDAIRAVGKPLVQPLVDTANALSYPLHEVKRGLSAAGQVMGAQHDSTSFNGPLFDQDAWSQAWKNSEDVSAGQVFIGNILDDAPFDIGQPQGPDRYALTAEAAEARKKFFSDTWAGRLSSGATDVALDFTVDPLIIGGKAGRAAQLASRVIKPGEVEAALRVAAPAKGADVFAESAKARRQGGIISDMFIKTDGMTESEIANLPQFRKSGDAGALASMFASANREFADDVVARHAAKADIFGAALGNTKSIQALKDRSIEMADELKRFGEPPTTTAALAQYEASSFGQKMIEAVNADDVDKVQALIGSRKVEHANLVRAFEASSSTSTIKAGPLESVSAAGRNEKVTGAFADRMKETIVPNGLGGAPIRFVVGSASTRVPDSVHLKDGYRGAEDLSSVINKMTNSTAATRRSLMDAFVKAPTEDARREVVRRTEKEIFEGAARKYQIPVKAVKHFMEQAQGRRGAYTDALKRAYSLAPADSNVVHFIDPEDGLTHVYQKAFLQTHLEDSHFITDPRVVEKFVKAGKNRRLLERWSDTSPTATKLHDAADATTDFLDNWGTMATRAWKDAALMRLAYPVRIQVDTQLRVMAHIGMMKYFMDGKATAMGRHLLSDKDGETSFKNVFKQGNYEYSLDKQLRKGEDVRGVPTNPAQSDEDVQRIVAGIQSYNGAAADLGNDISAATLRRMRKDGSYGKVKPEDPKWFDAYVRAVHQIRTSPTARKALETDDIDSLKAIVLADPKMNREWLNFEKTSDSIEEWLARIVQHNDYMLPTNELRSRIANPESMQDLFDHSARAQRLAEGAAHKETAATSKAANLDYRDLLKTNTVTARGLRDEYKAAREELKSQRKALQDQWQKAPARSQERRDLRAKLRALPKQQEATKAHKAELAALQEERQTLKVQQETFKSQRDLSKADADEALRPRKVKELAPSGKPEPMDVHGESFSPLTRNKWAERWEDFRNGWYSWAADAPETIMGRSPIYVDAFQRYVKESVARLDDEGIDLLGADAIRRSADKAARREVASVLFDATHTSNLAHGMRFLAPFFSAWEDTMKKWGKLMANDPALAPTLAKVWNTPDNLGLVQDSEGNQLKAGEKAANGRGEYIVIPKIKGLERVIPGNRDDKGKDDSGMFKLRKDNLNILFQGSTPYLPGMGPLVQIPANELVRRAYVKEGNNPLVKYVLPFGTTDDSVPYQLLPSWIKQVVDSGVGPLGDTKDFNQQFVILYNQEYGAWTRGERKTEPDEKEIRGKTKQWFLLRAGLNNASPVSIQPVPKDQFYIDKARQYRADPARKGHWQEDFYDDFPGYFEMSATLSVNETGLAATNDAYDASQKYKADIRKHPELGWFFAGADNLTGEFNPDVNVFQRSTEAGKGKNYRSLRDPMQAVKDIQAERGWVEYSKMATHVSLELEKRGLYNIQQRGAEDLAALKRDYTEYLGSQNQPWLEEFGPGQAEARRKVLVQVASEKWDKDPEFAKRPDQVLMQDYLKARQSVIDQLSIRKVKSLSNPANEDLASAWGSYTQYLVSQSPAFEQLYNRIFESDDLTQELT